MKQTVRTISRMASNRSAIFAAGFGLLAFVPVSARVNALPAGLQEPAASQTATGTTGTASGAASQAATDAGQSSAQDTSRKKLDKPDEVDPLKRQLTDKQKISRSREAKQEISSTYKTWVNQDVAYIISDEERKAFR